MPEVRLPVLPAIPGQSSVGVTPHHGRQWRSLADFASESTAGGDNPEFAPGASLPPDNPSRREMMKFMAASLAWAAAPGCGRQPPEHLVPRPHPDPQVVPGATQQFATAVLRSGLALGVLAESYSGRPIKLEGNPDHPASLGATDAFTQAETLQFYDPDRAQAVYGHDRIRTWDDFDEALRLALVPVRGANGRGLALLTGRITSPTLLAQIAGLLAELPEARWHVHEPLGNENARAGARMAFGKDYETVCHFDRASVVVALDCDFMSLPGAGVRYAHDFMVRRRAGLASAEVETNRLYAIEPTPTITGAKADHRLPLARSRVGGFLQALASMLGEEWAGSPDTPPLDAAEERWAGALADDLTAHRGAGLIVVGEAQPPAVHALTHWLNERLGNAGRTISFLSPVDGVQPRPQGLDELSAALGRGEVNALLIMDCNPAYSAPADLDFAARMRQALFCAKLGTQVDETAASAYWRLPMHHPLESWGDARAFDGTACIIQPLIDPLYESRSPIQFLQMVRGVAITPDLESVRTYWREKSTAADFESWWRAALRRGTVENSAFPAQSVAVDKERLQEGWAEWRDRPVSQTTTPYEAVFVPDPTIGDGRYANNAWLQEIPKPLNKITWGNAALISIALARVHGLENEDVVELTIDGRSVSAPVWIMPGQAAPSVTVSLGYGRTHGGRVAVGLGFSAYALRTAAHPWVASNLQVSKTPRRQRLAVTQRHHDMRHREPARHGTLEQFRRDPAAILGHAADHPSASFLPQVSYTGPQWAMVIDLTSCIGCNACTIACQAENNIPTVGKQEVERGREMHWIRVDTYYDGAAEGPSMVHQPVPCMHCENAPCEIVCPVAATSHSHDGLNEMTYNRCIGTRYCSNNCPYKVRRFNFFDYQGELSPVRRLLMNPGVTVRSRGVMEKCTYCVQRIRTGEIAAQRDGHPIRDGDIVTACQQVCPTRAIIFGNMNDAGSAVSGLRDRPHHYGLLAELNTRPRTTYLADIRNPNPAMRERET